MRINQISKKQASRNRKLAKIKATREKRCVICKKLGDDLAHLLPKSLFPEHYTNPLNLVILCRRCHKRFDDDIVFRRKQKGLYEQIKRFDEQGAYRYFKICEIE